MIVVPMPAWRPQSPIKHLWKLESRTLNWEAEDARQVAISAKTCISLAKLPSLALTLAFVCLFVCNPPILQDREVIWQTAEHAEIIFHEELSAP